MGADGIMQQVERFERAGVTMTGAIAGPVRFGFTERTGGVSAPPFESLNLGSHVGDDPVAVAENRRRALAALGAEGFADRLLVPNQVHGDRIVTVTAADTAPEDLERVRADIAEGADAIVCTAPGVPVLLCFADCAPVVLAAPGGFAVVHSGWRGTFARIAGKAALALADAAGCPASEIEAFIGPHILGDEYEVSPELMERFAGAFDAVDASSGRLLDLSACIIEALEQVGVSPDGICDTGLSTMRENDRFFSYRAEHGRCGRHGAIAVLPRPAG